MIQLDDVYVQHHSRLSSRTVGIGMGRFRVTFVNMREV